MSPNEPHWGNRGSNGNRGGKRGDEQGPPDLEDIWRDFNQRLSGIFGRRREGGPTGPGGPGRPGLPSFKQVGGGIGALVLLVLVVWLCSGFYIVDANERAVVLRLGSYNTVTQPGLNWRLPWPIETEEKVNFTGLRMVSIGGQDSSSRVLMLTGDQNIVTVQFAVQYRLRLEQGDDNRERAPRDYLFNNDRISSDEFMQQIAETAMREIVGKSKMDFVLDGAGREKIAADAQGLIQRILDRYGSGLQVERVTMEDMQPPEQVKDAFYDATTRATQDRQRHINEGEAYENDVVPRARGTAERLRAEAEAHRTVVVAMAEGETARFKQVLSEFKRAPQVTRERMYLDAVQQVLSNTSKVMIDSKSGNNLLYLPIDKLVQQSGVGTAVASAGVAQPGAAPSALPPPPASSSQGLQGSPRGRDSLRDRGRRGDR